MPTYKLTLSPRGGSVSAGPNRAASAGPAPPALASVNVQPESAVQPAVPLEPADERARVLGSPAGPNLGSASSGDEDEAGCDPEQAKKDLNTNTKAAELLINDFKSKTRPSSTGKYHVASFVFQFVLLGTELDMVGLGMSFLTYWQYNFRVLQFLAAYAIIGFFGPLLYVNLLQLWGGVNGTSQEGTPDVERATLPNSNKPSGRVARWLAKIQDISPFHWVPCARFFMLLLKDVTDTDVKALFTVNTLSSFTFGIFQIMGIAMTFYLGEPVTVFVLINIFSQVLNWTITCSYSLTPIAKWMGNAASVESVTRKADDYLKAWSKLGVEYGDSIPADDEEARQKLEKQKTKFRACILKMTVDSFFPINENADAVSPHHRSQIIAKKNAMNTLECMPDTHLKQLIDLWRDQQLANLP